MKLVAAEGHQPESTVQQTDHRRTESIGKIQVGSLGNIAAVRIGPEMS
jgi:hypothetical protein